MGTVKISDSLLNCNNVYMKLSEVHTCILSVAQLCLSLKFGKIILFFGRWKDKCIFLMHIFGKSMREGFFCKFKMIENIL